MTNFMPTAHQLHTYRVYMSFDTTNDGEKEIRNHPDHKKETYIISRYIFPKNKAKLAYAIANRLGELF